MKITEKQVDEHIEMIRQDTGKVLTRQEGNESLYKLLTLVSILYLPAEIQEILGFRMGTNIKDKVPN